jgi:DNA-binding NtrC family response regulator
LNSFEVIIQFDFILFNFILVIIPLDLKQIKVFIVDDDDLFLKALVIQFRENPIYEVITFATGELCVEEIHNIPDIVILDYHLNSIEKNAMNGLKTLDIIKKINNEIPVIMVSAQDKIEVAVSCIHHKAFDYVVKSETAFVRLQQIITTIFKYKKMEKQLNWYMDRM